MITLNFNKSDSRCFICNNNYNFTPHNMKKKSTDSSLKRMLKMMLLDNILFSARFTLNETWVGVVIGAERYFLIMKILDIMEILLKIPIDLLSLYNFHLIFCFLTILQRVFIQEIR